jgi:tetratricopeptide (TPR) repeat protein
MRFILGLLAVFAIMKGGNAGESAPSCMTPCAMPALATPAGSFEEAEASARGSLERAHAARPVDHIAAAVALNDLAQACRFQNRNLEAERYYRDAIVEWETAHGPSHPDVAKGLMNLAAFYHERDRETGAEDLYRRAVAILERSFGPHYPQVLVARNELADVLRGERRFAESDKLGNVTLAAMEKTFRYDDPRLGRALANRVRLLLETHRESEAARVDAQLRRCRESYR